MHTFVERLRRSPSGLLATTTLCLAAPLLVAILALSQRTWYPVLDLAMTEFRIRDVGTRQTPLIGLPGRIGEFPDQGSHPGPINFWLLAPGYRLFGSSAWAMEASTALLQTCWIGLALWIGHRRAGRNGLLVVALGIAILLRGYGLSVLTQPWNPYLPLIAWVVILLATWSVVARDHAMLVPLVIAASFSAQTHIPYLVMAGGLGAGSAVLVAGRWIRDRQTSDSAHAPRALLVTAGIFVMLSLPILVDQLRRTPGNITRLGDHFGEPPEEAIGLVAGFDLLARHLNVLRATGTLFTGNGGFVELGQLDDATWVPGAVLVVAWMIAVGATVRLRERANVSLLTQLHVVNGAVLLLGWLSMSRIFGATWFYLTLWAWAIMLLVVVATIWTTLLWFDWPLERFRQVGVRSGSVAVVACTLTTSVAAASIQHPEEHLGETLGAAIEPTAAALNADERYVVFWTDAHSFGSQGFGLVSELERRGFDVGAYEAWRVPITGQRVVGIDDVDAEIIWATGSFVDVWRADERVSEIIAVEPRTPEELIEFESLRSTLVEDLRTNELDDLIPLVDTNLFGVRIDQRISPTALEATKRMLDLDQNAAVFIGPAGVSQ